MNLHLFLLSAFITIGWSTASQSRWGYPNLDEGEDFPNWGGLCDTGSNQSPIDLTLRGALKGEFEKLVFENFDDKQSDVSMVNNGHTIQLSGFPFEMELSSGPLLDEYVVEQIHLHWWSEHTVDNIRYPLEVHIVHRNKRYPNMTVAPNHKDGIAVLGVLYHVSNQHNDAIDLILENLDAVKSYANLNKPVSLKQSIVVRDLFPDIDEGYFTYEGSLTTPGCSEAVTWIVLRESFPVTLQQVDRFKEIEHAEGQPLKNNYREIQPTNNRPVIAVLPSLDRNGASGSLHMSALTFLLMAGLSKFLR